MRIIHFILFVFQFITLIDNSSEGDRTADNTENELFNAVKPFLLKTNDKTDNELLNAAKPFLKYKKNSEKRKEMPADENELGMAYNTLDDSVDNEELSSVVKPYVKGLALTSLRKYLEDVMRNNGVEVKTGPEQVYIMENDSFKFIHEVKNKVDYTQADYEHMEFSWSLSKSESSRLLQYILNLKPHKPMDTFSLNQARSYILALAQPLAKISQAIQTDITVLTDKRDFLQDLDDNEMDLEMAKDAMKITQSYYEIEYLPFPRTVCASKQHTEIVLDDQGQQKILYKTICHEQCGVKDVAPETSHCNQLKGCLAMQRTEHCKECGCHYTEHMHIRYLQHLKTKLVDDDQQIAGVANKLEKTHDKKAAVEEMIIKLEKRVDDQRAEQAIISKSSAQLSTYLKRHAIMTYNDAIEEYVLMSINDEKQIAAVTGDSRKVDGLEDCLKAYREEKRILDAAMDNNLQAENDEFDVQAIYGELINLHINGKNIKEMFDAEFDSQKKIFDFSECSYSRPNGRKASQNNNRSRHFNNQQQQRGFQQQPYNLSSMHGGGGGGKQQYANARSMSSAFDDFNDNYEYTRRKESSWFSESMGSSSFSSTMSYAQKYPGGSGRQESFGGYTRQQSSGGGGYGHRRQGLALTSLRKYLEDVMRNNGVEVKTGPEQVYIMENDSFKFIHEVKNKVDYTQADYEHMEFSWSLSKSESSRLLQYILNLKPHKPMDTFSLNQARSYILALAQPLAKISQAIQTDITVLTDKRDFLQDLDDNEMDLEMAKDAMKITQSYYEIEYLPFPRTVCASKQHTEIVLDDQGQQKILYKTICHEQCGVKDVAPETSHCNQLKGCLAMQRTEHCKECGCHYTEHMHIRYLQHLKTKLVDDDQQIAGVANKLEKTHDKKAAVEEMIIKLEKRVDDQRAEQAIISKSSAQLSTYLKRHAIMTYNDAIEEYVLMSINDEKQIAAVTGDSRKVDGLEDCLKAYREEKRILDAAMDNNLQAENDEFDVQAIYGELINLHINGKNIKEMFDAEFDSQKKIFDFSECSYSRPNGRKASQNNNRSRHFNNQQQQRGFQQQPYNLSSMHGGGGGGKQQYANARSMSSAFDDFNDNYEYTRRKESSWFSESMGSSSFSSTMSYAQKYPGGSGRQESFGGYTRQQSSGGGGYGHRRQESSSNWTGNGNNYGNTSYRPHQQPNQQQRNGQSGNAWGQQSTSSSASRAQQMPKPNTSSSSSASSYLGRLPIVGRFLH